MRKARWLVVLVVGLMLASAASVQAYDVYKNGVPDVDKPAAGESTCWINSAANVLGAAGWGTGADAQAKGDNIRSDLVAHFGTVTPGWSSLAINWWLLNKGLNSDSSQYNPDLATTYTDVTVIIKSLTDADYDWLLDELFRCQYVNVSFEIPYAEVGHEMTLVGGNYSFAHVPPGAMPQDSVWHDGDAIGGPIDTVYGNIWSGTGPTFWHLDQPNTPGNPLDDWEANAATLLCPGLIKPDYAMENFDYAWFKDMDPAGTLFNSSRLSGTEAGSYAFGATAPPQYVGGTQPEWDQDPDVYELYLPNEEMPDPWHKEIWLLVDYIDRTGAGDPGVLIQDPEGNQFVPTNITWSTDAGQVLLHWVLEDQPDWEKIIFPNASYRELYDISTGLGGTVKDWNLATYCIPEPATMGLLVIAGLALLRRRF